MRVPSCSTAHAAVLLSADFWTDFRRSDFKNTAEAVREALVGASREAGIGFPEPDVRIIRRTGDELG